MGNQQEKQRVLPFKKITNFRDLGGYLAADGRSVRWGRLFRSGHLAGMTRKDQALFNSLGLRLVVDFRSVAEREHQPDKLPKDAHLKMMQLSILDEGNATMNREIRWRIEKKEYRDFDVRDLMRDAYRQFSTDFTSEYRQFFHALLGADGEPVLWHCTAGKDRTGYAAAVLLQLLGVDWETIMQDYLLSKAHVSVQNKQIMLLRLLKGKQAVSLVKPLLTVQEDWLEAAFQAIQTHWGDFNAYLQNGLELTSADIAQLKSVYLE